MNKEENVEHNISFNSVRKSFAVHIYDVTGIMDSVVSYSVLVYTKSGMSLKIYSAH